MSSTGNLPYGSSADDYNPKERSPVSIEDRLSRIRNEFKAKPSLRRIMDADLEHNLSALKLIEVIPVEVTFKDFQRLMIKRKHTVDDLLAIFHGKLDDSRNFFERVMSCRWRNPEARRYEYRSDVVIPYKSVFEFYRQELHHLENSKKKPYVVAEPGKRVCVCGCGEAVFGHKRWARPGCKKRLQRAVSGRTGN
jgi:hypothetical protein